MKFKAFIIIIIIAITTISCKDDIYEEFAPVPVISEGEWESPNGAGQLTIKDDIRILKLAGSNYEMGYAHGYLLAEEIIYLLDNMSAFLMYDLDTSYPQLVKRSQKLSWGGNYENELQGMIDGINDRLPAGDRIIHTTEGTKAVELIDLKIYNALSDWGCSSFSAWGKSRKDESLIFARNFDYHSGQNEAFKNGHVIISFDDGTTNQWVTASLCGFIGCISGMNSNGMTLAIHDTNHDTSTDESGYLARCMILRKIAEFSKEDWTPSDVGSAMDDIVGYTGMNLHITFPAESKKDNDIAGVIEYDGNALHSDGRATVRLPENNLSLYKNGEIDQQIDNTHSLICTNHYLMRKTYSSGSEESATRYEIIKDGLAAAQTDGDVSIEEAIGILSKVGGNQTVHSVVFEPDAMKLHFFLPRPQQAGFNAEMRTFDFSELF